MPRQHKALSHSSLLRCGARRRDETMSLTCLHSKCLCPSKGPHMVTIRPSFLPTSQAKGQKCNDVRFVPFLSSSAPLTYPFDGVAPAAFASPGFIQRLDARSGCVRSEPVSTIHTLILLLPYWLAAHADPTLTSFSAHCCGRSGSFGTAAGESIQTLTSASQTVTSAPKTKERV